MECRLCGHSAIKDSSACMVRFLNELTRKNRAWCWVHGVGGLDKNWQRRKSKQFSSESPSHSRTHSRRKQIKRPPMSWSDANCLYAYVRRYAYMCTTYKHIYVHNMNLYAYSHAYLYLHFPLPASYLIFHLSVYLCMHVSICPSIYPSIHPPIHLSI